MENERKGIIKHKIFIDHERFTKIKSFQMKTVSVALVLCLNVGVDPPDVVKTQPCARLECWIGTQLKTLPKITISLYNSV